MAIGESILENISRADSKDRVKLLLRFSEIPQHDLVTNVRRINLILPETNGAPGLRLPQSDINLVKTLLRRKKQFTELSFFLRYPPKNVSISRAGKANTLIIDILLGNPLSAKYPDITAQIKEVSFLQRKEIDFTHPLRLSKFANDWRGAFKKYESEVIIEPDFLYTMPPYPLLASFSNNPISEEITGSEIMAAAKSEKWDMVHPQLKEKLLKNSDISIAPQLYISYCEALVRNNEYQEPFKLAQQIIGSYPDSPAALIAQFLTIYLQLRHEDPYSARISLEKFEKKNSHLRKILPFFNLLRTEAAIVTGKYEEAEKLLARPDIGYPEEVAHLRLLRQADLRHLRKNYIAALVSYLQLADVSNVINNQPRSLAYFCENLYRYAKYPEAEKYYERLATLLTEKDEQDLVLYRLALTRLKLRGPEKASPSLYQIQDSFPNTRGAFLAHLKITDLTFLYDNISYPDAAARYDFVAENGTTKALRQEAFFKKALIYFLSGDKQRSIDLLMQTLREFTSGPLQIECKALLISQLPEAIHEMVANEYYIEALVLAKKSRSFFTGDLLEKPVLLDLTDAYMALGAFDRAANLLTHLIDSSKEEEQEPLFKPLLESLYRTGWYELLEHYGQRYFDSFANGPDSKDIYLLRLQGMRQVGDETQLLALLNSPHPTSREIERETAEIYFDLERYDDAVSLLLPLTADTSEADPSLLFRLAESYYQTRQLQTADTLFQKVTGDNRYGDQALFRLAQISLADNRSQNALNIFTKLAEKEPQSLWSKLAAEEIGNLGLNK